MTCTAFEIYQSIDAFAPFDTALAGDNVGLLLGRMDREVCGVLTALDATPDIVREAETLGAQLIVTHHPLLFAPVQRLDEAEPEPALVAQMIRANISLIAAHTNLDIAPGGVNDALAAQMELPVERKEGFLALGQLPTPLPLHALAAHIGQRLSAHVQIYGPLERLVSRFASCSGSGGTEACSAAMLGTEVFITGEIKHSQALDALQRGMTVLAAGHYETEICAADLLAKHLQSASNALQWKLDVYASRLNPFR